MNHTEFKIEIDKNDIDYVLSYVGKIIACRLQTRNIRLRECEEKLREDLEGYLYDILYKRPRGREGQILLNKIYLNEKSR